MVTRDALNAAVDAARAAVAQANTPANREALKAAWNARAATVTPPKPRGFGSRAGQRQAREREALRQDSLRAAADRRFRR